MKKSVAIAAAMTVKVSGTLLARYYRHPKIVLQDGTVLQDLSVAEVGDYMDARYLPLRKAYLRNKARYDKLDRAELVADPSRVSQAITGNVVELMRNAPLSSAAFRSQPREVVDALREHWSLMLARCAGMPAADYLKQLPALTRIEKPKNTGTLGNAIKEFLGENPESLQQNEQAITSAFERLYELSLKDGKTSSRIVGIAKSNEAIAVAMDYVTLPGASDLLAERLSPDALKFFVGLMTQGQLIFHQSAGALHASAEPVLQAEVIFICYTAGGDAFPLCLISRFDPQSRHWTLVKACRQLSPKMVFTVPLTF